MSIPRTVTAAAVVAAGAVLVIGAAPASASGRAAGGITICHATHSASTAYVVESPDAQSIVRSSGHGQHLGDIVPAFDWTDSRGATHRFAGVNVDRLSWIARGCTASTGTSVPGSSGSGVVPPPVVSDPAVVSRPVGVPPQPVVASPPVVVPPLVVPVRPVVARPLVVPVRPVVAPPLVVPVRPVVAPPPPVVVSHPADPVRRVSAPTTQLPKADTPVPVATIPAPSVPVSRFTQRGQTAAAVVPELPRTGAEPIPLRGGLGLVLVGALLLLARRLLRGGYVS